MWMTGTPFQVTVHPLMSRPAVVLPVTPVIHVVAAGVAKEEPWGIDGVGVACSRRATVTGACRGGRADDQTGGTLPRAVFSPVGNR